MTRIRRFALLAALVAVAAGLAAEPGPKDPIEEILREQIAAGADFSQATQAAYSVRQQDLRRVFESRDFEANYGKHRLAEGRPFARLTIPSLGVDLIVIEGVSGDALRAGAGHYPETAYPGRKGNVAVAGHRTGYGAPFARLDTLGEGDTAILESPEGRFEYRVASPFDGHTNPWVTEPLDWTVIAPTTRPSLTLTTADPPHTSKNRLVVRLVLAS